MAKITLTLTLGLDEEELSKLLKPIIRDAIQGAIHPVLDNFHGFVGTQWLNQEGEKLPSSEKASAVASVGETVQLVVTIQKDKPESGDYKLIDIFQGKDVEEVTFEVKIVSESLSIMNKSRIELTVPTTRGEGAFDSARFAFTVKDEDEGVHSLYLQVYQKKEFIQCVRTILEVVRSRGER